MEPKELAKIDNWIDMMMGFLLVGFVFFLITWNIQVALIVISIDILLVLVIWKYRNYLL